MAPVESAYRSLPGETPESLDDDIAHVRSQSMPNASLSPDEMARLTVTSSGIHKATSSSHQHSPQLYKDPNPTQQPQP